MQVLTGGKGVLHGAGQVAFVSQHFSRNPLTVGALVRWVSHRRFLRKIRLRETSPVRNFSWNRVTPNPYGGHCPQGQKLCEKS